MTEHKTQEFSMCKLKNEQNIDIKYSDFPE